MADDPGSPIWNKLYRTVLALALLCGMSGILVALFMDSPEIHLSRPGIQYVRDSGGMLKAIKQEDAPSAAMLGWSSVSQKEVELQDEAMLANDRSFRFTLSGAGFLPLIILVALNRWWSWLKRPE